MTHTYKRPSNSSGCITRDIFYSSKYLYYIFLEGKNVFYIFRDESLEQLKYTHPLCRIGSIL